MKINLVRIAVLLTALAVLSTGSALSQGKSAGKGKSQKETKAKKDTKSQNIELFNGKDLNGWVFYLKDQSVDPATVFTVRNGVINIKGDPFGYMRTKKSYSDYNLHVEWRYPEELSNSGVFVHAQGPDTIWPKCVENQLKAGGAGDYVLMNGAEIIEQTDKTKRVVAKMTASNEKPLGEWNSMDVICNGNTIETKINGMLQNKGTGLNITEGGICLQSEGKSIEFRNVFITKIKK